MIKNTFNLEQSIKMKAAWKKRENYTHGLFGTKFHNTWRAMKFTIKGKKAGCEWKTFKDFKNDMYSSYQEGFKICRLDKTLPFSKQNCVWVSASDTGNLNRVAKLEYLGEIKTLKEWCLINNLNYNGVRQRYYKGKNYTSHEILFGKPKQLKREMLNERELNDYNLRAKASKMLAQYRLKDRKMNLPECDLTIDEFIENFLKKECVYCSTKDFVGADRMDNFLSHIRANLVPCCYRCNVVKHTHFTYDEMLKLGAFIKNEIDAKK